jgi:hypothetical protein
MIERIEMNKHTKSGGLQKTLVFSAISSFFLLAQAADVTPPPLPLGSTMVRQHAGVSPEEVERNKRAHHHKGHYKKDVTRDDTMDAVPDDKNTENNLSKQSPLFKSK